MNGARAFVKKYSQGSVLQAKIRLYAYCLAYLLSNHTRWSNTLKQFVGWRLKV